MACTNRLLIDADGISLKGWNREDDVLSYTGAAGAGDFITIDNVNCEINSLKLTSTNGTASDVVLRAFNFNYGTFNDGRLKVLTLINCQFRDCFDVHHIEGFDLVDIQNCLFWYIKATTMGCHFKNVSKLQISSCEYVRWFDESTIPTPSGYATTPLVELLANGAGNGFGAVNINGSIIHPQITQSGLKIDAGSTTGFGTITGNSFISTGLTPNTQVATITLTGTSGAANVLMGGFQNYLATFNTSLTQTAADFVTAYASEFAFRFGITLTSSGVDLIFTGSAAGNVFNVTSITNAGGNLAGTLVQTTPVQGVVADLELDSQNAFIVQGNQGIRNSNAKGSLAIQGNTSAMTAPTSYQVLSAATVAGGAFTSSPFFPVGSRVITNRDECSFEYNNKNTGSFMVVLTATVDGSNAVVSCRLRNNGVSIPFAVGVEEIKGSAVSLSFSVIGTATLGDVFDAEFITTGVTLTVTDFTLNGYQF